MAGPYHWTPPDKPDPNEPETHPNAEEQQEMSMARPNELHMTLPDQLDEGREVRSFTPYHD